MQRYGIKTDDLPLLQGQHPTTKAVWAKRESRWEQKDSYWGVKRLYTVDEWLEFKRGEIEREAGTERESSF